MISLAQIEQLSRKYKTNTTVIAREYLQQFFLQNFYENKGSEKIFFKGGTAIHFLMGGFRFSEDLDFTCETDYEVVDSMLGKTIKNISLSVSGLSIKEKKTITGKSYLLTLKSTLLFFPVFIRLDFSFREKVLQKKQGLVQSDFPVIFSSFIHYMGEEEILAEKIRAVLTRDKGRDLFDIWFLLSKGFELNQDFIKKKMAYYPSITFDKNKLIKKINNYDFAKFKNDLQPFIPFDKRAKIDELFAIVKLTAVKKIRH